MDGKPTPSYICGMQAETIPMVVPADYPELAGLIWNGDPKRPLHPQDAFTLYERYWRFVDRERMGTSEAALIERLADAFGHGRLLV